MWSIKRQERVARILPCAAGQRGSAARTPFWVVRQRSDNPADAFAPAGMANHVPEQRVPGVRIDGLENQEAHASACAVHASCREQKKVSPQSVR